MSVLLPATGSNRKGKDKKKKSLRIRKNKDSDPGHGGSVEPSMIKPPTRDCCGKESSKRRTKESTDNDENSTVQSKNKTPAGSKRKEKDVCLTAEQESANAALVKHCTAENFLQTAKDEFTEIQALEIDPALHARCCQSKDRNRFPDTIPCLDATRVVLQAGHDGVKPTDDFIHASKIVIDKLERPYIAAQAPKDGYFEDFWKMIFQEGSTTVLVLFSYFEEGKQVCEELYPAEVGTYKYFGKMFLNNKKIMTLSRKPSLGTTTVFDLNDNIDYFKISGTEMHVQERALHLEVGQVISTGTFSKVYNVRQVNTKQDFALKVKNYSTETEKKVADHEKNIVSLLMKDKKSCQFIIKIHGCFEYKSLICAIMTRGDTDLNSYLEKNGRKPLPMSFVKPTACQLLDAVEYIHARGVLHLNIKPENCILKSMGGNKYLLKLCDFGSARLETDQEGLLSNSHGSLCYRAPEIIFGSSVNFRSDIWSCGLVIAEMYMGVALFPAVNEWQMAMFCRQLLGSMDLSSGDRYDMFFSYNFMEDSDDIIPYKSYLAAGGEGDYIPEDQLPDNRQHDLTSLDQMVEMGHNCSQLNYISSSDIHLLEVLYHMVNITPFYRLSASELKSFDFFIPRTSKRRLSL